MTPASKLARDGAYPVSLCRHTGGERRRQISPSLSSTTLFNPFARWQAGRNPCRTIRYGVTRALRLPLETHGAPGAGRMQRSAPIFRTVPQ